MKTVTLIDTGICNIASMKNAFSRIGCNVVLTNSPEKLSCASIIVLPGVGAFEEGMRALNKYGLIEPLKQKVMTDKVPILGVCLGLQLLAEKSYENGLNVGLGFIAGEVIKLKSATSEYRIPNIGWFDVVTDKKCHLFDDSEKQSAFYHVHSYHLSCKNAEDVAAHINYDDKEITVAVERENVFGVQFHPEKSQDAGLDLLSRTINSLPN